MKKVLVTGAAGFIGSNMVKFLLENSDYEIIGVDNFVGGESNKQFIEKLHNENSDRFKFIKQSFVDVDTNGIDIVYHFAAIPRVLYSVEKPLETNEGNVTNTLKLLMNCKKNNVKRFVFSSSSSVYGDVKNFPTKENEQKIPKSPYALQKSIIEDYCRLWSQLYDLDTVCLRYFNVYGPNQYAENSYATVICAWVKGYITNNDIRLDGDGTQSRDFTYVTDICNANFIVGNYNGKFMGKCFNAAGGNNYSLNQIKNIVEQLSNNRPNIINRDVRLGDVIKTHSDSTALGEYGFNCKTTLIEGIKNTYNWYNNIVY